MAQPKILKVKPMDRKMKLLNFSLLSLVFAGTFIFGVNILFLTLTVIVVDLVFEVLFAYFRNKEVDQGWLYNALIFVLILPPTVPLWIAAVGAGFAAFFGKLVFGGYPKYVFNPAVVGVIFISISFPQFLNTQWLNPVTGIVDTGNPMITWTRGQDVFATYPLINLLLGNVPGLVGEVSRGLIILLGFFLIATKVIDWKAPVAFLVSLVGLGYLGQIYLPGTVANPGLDIDFVAGFFDPLSAILVGGALFAAFFLLTDKPTLPVTTGGRFIYGFLFAFFTLLIRVYAAWPEGVIFATIIVNALSPIMDSMVARKSVSELITAEVE
jgi:Na+-translocating ferredoxin:NAD+ oxidoreductase RnfD subunit